MTSLSLCQVVEQKPRQVAEKVLDRNDTRVEQVQTSRAST